MAGSGTMRNGNGTERNGTERARERCGNERITVSLFASDLIRLFLKLIGKSVFRAFQLKFQEQYSRVNVVKS